MQWLKLLQGYVDNIYSQTDRLSSDLNTKETMIQVLIMELMLGRQATHKIYDSSLNQALLYRLVSLMNVSDPNKTLQKSFLSLFTQAEFDAALPFNNDDAFVLSNILCSQDNENVESIEPAKYESEMTLLTVNEQAINIQPKDLDKENLYLPLSARMGLWHGLSIRLDEKPPVKLRGKVGTTIEHYKELWEYINHSLFAQKRKTSKKKNSNLYNDDETVIIVTKQLAGQLMFECQVVEDGYEGTGTLDVLNDVVPFFPGDVNLQSFQYQGMPLLLHAYVKKVNSDGTYQFAMRDMISEYEDDVRVNDLFYNSRLTCLLCSQVPGLQRVPAVSSEGFSVSIAPAPGMTIDDLQRGMIVEVDNITNLTFLLSSQCKGAVAFGEYFVALNYYVVIEFGPKWYDNLDHEVTTTDCRISRTVKGQILKAFKQFVWGINQPASNRCFQSPFTNISYYDHTYFNALFKDFCYPDGSKPEWKAVDTLQRLFMKWFNEVRLKQVLTFPVETFAMVHDGQDIIDKDYKELCAEMYAEGHSFFTYISDSADSLASCCRLRNELAENTFSPTSGLTGVMTGSCNVITINVNRFVQDTVRKHALQGHWQQHTERFKEELVAILERVYKYHIAFKTMLYDLEDKGMFAASNGGYIYMSTS